MEQKVNLSLRIGVVALIVAIITMVGLSGTFAKYTSGTNSSSQEARVAKWGVTITGDPTGLFKSSYQVGENTIVKSTTGTDLVIAPGTSGTATLASVTRTTANVDPEVAVGISAQITEAAGWSIFDESWTDGSNFYCPLVLTVNGESCPAYSSAANVNSWFANKVASASSWYPGSTWNDLTLTISWSWPFNETDVASRITTQSNVNDTKLGNAATPAKIRIPAMSVTATQLNS